MLHAFQTDRTFRQQFSQVWMGMDSADRSSADIGVDLVARHTGGTLTAIQCKCSHTRMESQPASASRSSVSLGRVGHYRFWLALEASRAAAAPSMRRNNPRASRPSASSRRDARRRSPGAALPPPPPQDWVESSVRVGGGLRKVGPEAFVVCAASRNSVHIPFGIIDFTMEKSSPKPS
jgi:hypothetical protein